MADFAEIKGELKCWKCGRACDSMIEIQWGKLRNSYKLGDEIRWFKIEGGIVPPFTIIKGRRPWNFGDPSILRLLAFDGKLYDYDPSESEKTKIKCETCNAILAGAAARIEGGHIVSIDTYSPQQMYEIFGCDIGKSNIVVYDKLGQYLVKTEWYDGEFRTIEEFP